MLPLGITRVWLDQTESNVLYILAHRDLQTYFSQGIHSSPAKDTSEVNNVKTEHSQKENSCVCCQLRCFHFQPLVLAEIHRGKSKAGLAAQGIGAGAEVHPSSFSSFPFIFCFCQRCGITKIYETAPSEDSCIKDFSVAKLLNEKNTDVSSLAFDSLFLLTCPTKECTAHQCSMQHSNILRRKQQQEWALKVDTKPILLWAQLKFQLCSGTTTASASFQQQLTQHARRGHEHTCLLPSQLFKQFSAQLLGPQIRIDYKFSASVTTVITVMSPSSVPD